ncbi:MAG: tRNA 2-thiouridine(34) synthase MnmA [Rhodospirillales bacterium]|nr:tRNA 2-thiouridine(34) synthase MnmA [Alphaproteobacteria bacterium]MCB9986356.1 tRNA 2-thiouridine(34) synthase MnmA [Rhodospirillales bacterium]USO07095.1 MAG: tRNA 2-thiouridine(34) synthase MnmA [Rhodospirillales bacterium]
METGLNSLGFAKPPKDTRVVVAMSGGVDSSVVASLLHEEGYDVVGVTLQLYDHGLALEKKGACCAGQDIYDAQMVAQARGFPHYVLNYENRFSDAVMQDFADSYLHGRTPIPCVRCNQTVKFRDLLAVAKDLGADCMATGHYIRRVVNDGRAELHRAHDPAKDQSYFLFATTQEQLDFLRFPLGVWSKDVTREHARRLGLVTAAKPDSQDICFVPNGDYAAVVERLRPDAVRPGDIVHVDGRVLGRHRGVVGYTVGQRKGIGVGGGHTENNTPLYVVKVDAENARVVVGPREALACDTVTLTDCNWLGADVRAVTVKLRSVAQPVPARLDRAGGRIRLETPQYGISPGQAAVCYDGDRVLGGGWIAAAA